MPKNVNEDIRDEEIIDEAEQDSKDATEEQHEEETGASDLETLIRDTFSAAHNDGKAEDEVKLAMISAGATFKNVTRLFNQFMVDSGLAVSKEEKDQILATVLTGADLSDETTFNAKVEELMAALVGVNDKSASALIRAYAKKAGIEAFKKAKASTGEGKVGFASGFYDYLLANPTCSVEQATAFVNGTDGNAETSENVKRHLSHYLGVHRLVNRVAGVEVA